jgi:hypothetical protein
LMPRVMMGVIFELEGLAEGMYAILAQGLI